MEKVIPIEREKYKKIQTFQIYGFLKYFKWSRNPYNSQNMGKVELIRTHATPNVSEFANSNKMEIFCGTSYHSQAVGFLEN